MGMKRIHVMMEDEMVTEIDARRSYGGASRGEWVRRHLAKTLSELPPLPELADRPPGFEPPQIVKTPRLVPPELRRVPDVETFKRH